MGICKAVGRRVAVARGIARDAMGCAGRRDAVAPSVTWAAVGRRGTPWVARAAVTPWGSVLP